MATYNGANYIGEQLQSLASQDYSIAELVISDDCSTDSTVAICRDFSRKVNFQVTILDNTERIGYSKNFFRGLASCHKGDLIMFCDQDDSWKSQKVAVLVNWFQQNPKVLLAIHDVEFCDSRLVSVGYTKLQRIRLLSNPYFTYVTGMATAMRRELLDLAIPLPDNPNFSYDSWVHRLAIALDVKTVIPNVLALYRRHEKNVTGGNSLNAATKNVRSRYARRKFQSSPQLSLMTQLEIWANVRERLLERYNIENPNRSLGVKRASKFQRNALWRLGVREKSLLVRVPLVLLGIIVGRYRQFSGISSAAKDIMQQNTRNPK